MLKMVANGKKIYIARTFAKDLKKENIYWQQKGRNLSNAEDGSIPGIARTFLYPTSLRVKHPFD